MAFYPYSFKELVGVMTFPGFAPWMFAGEESAESVAVEMVTDRTVHTAASDGAIMVSYVSAANGRVTIEMQQVSPIHQFLINVFNYLTAQGDQAALQNYAAGVMEFQDTVSGDRYRCTGVTPVKIPNVPHGREGANVSWILLCANIDFFAPQF